MVASTVNPTRLRENLYGILDEVLATGTPVAIDRKGRVLTLSAQPSGSRVAGLVAHPGSIAGDPEAFVSLDWSPSSFSTCTRRAGSRWNLGCSSKTGTRIWG